MVRSHRLFTYKIIWVLSYFGVIFGLLSLSKANENTENTIPAKELAREVYLQLEDGIVKKVPELGINANYTAKEGQEVIQSLTLTLLIDSLPKLKTLANMKADPQLADFIASSLRNSYKLQQALHKGTGLADSPLPAIAKIVDEFAQLIISKY